MSDYSYNPNFHEAIKNIGEGYYHPQTIEGYIKRYQTQIDFGYDKDGYCQGLIDLLNELKSYRKAAASVKEKKK